MEGPREGVLSLFAVLLFALLHAVHSHKRKKETKDRLPRIEKQ